jgi:hypothetical protein
MVILDVGLNLAWCRHSFPFWFRYMAPLTRLTIVGADQSRVQSLPPLLRTRAEGPVELRSIARTWFLKMRQCGDDVREMIHDGCPVACVEDAPFGYLNSFRAHVNVGFFHAAELSDLIERPTWTLRRGSALANLRENGDAVPRITSSDRALHVRKRRMFAINCHCDLPAQTRLAQPGRHAAGDLP